MRGPPTAPGELADAVEPGEQGLAVERYRSGWPPKLGRASDQHRATPRAQEHQAQARAIVCTGSSPASAEPGRSRTATRGGHLIPLVKVEQ